MKLHVLILTTALTAGIPATAITEEPNALALREQAETDTEINAFADFDLINKYRFRGINFGDDPVFQTYAGVDFGNGFSVSTFINADSGIKDFNEFSFFATYCRDTSKATVCAEGSYGIFPNLGLDNTYGLTASATLNTRFSPKLEYGTDFNLAKGSHFVALGISDRFKIKNQPVDWDTRVAYNNQYYTEGEELSLLEVGATIPIQTKKGTVRPQIRYIQALGDSIKSELIAGLGFSF